MKAVKGGTSRMVTKELKAGDWFAWQPNYAAFAVSASHVARVIRYINGQKEHHRNNTLWSEAEATDEPDDSDNTDAATDTDELKDDHGY